ncbi:MAG TPA: DUF4253 domain-containing protein [Nitrospirota bacterium]
MADKVRVLFACMLLMVAVPACKYEEKPVEQKKPEPIVIFKQKHPVLSAEQRAELRFHDDVISQIELAAGAEAEPFFVTVVVPSENMKGEPGFEAGRLAGFSVRTKYSEEIIGSYRPKLRARGYLIFKSQRGYGSLPDIVTVTRGGNSYDIVKMQGTEAPGFNLGTGAIIAWLKERQAEASFAVTGAGADWIEARFTKPPQNMRAFAKKVADFSPDTLDRGSGTIDSLTERMNKINGFTLVWD